MGLEKAIKHGKEHRTAYGTNGQPYAKSVSKHCRNHGGKTHKKRHSWECEWCLGNRTYRDKKLKEKANQQIEEFEK